MSNNLIDLMAETFRSNQRRSLCTYWGSMIGPIDADGGGLYCVGLAAVHMKPGVQRPRRGMSSVVEALAAKARHDGADIRTNAVVERVLVADNVAVGVRLADGTEIRTRRGVLAAVPPESAYGPLLDDGVVDTAVRAKVATMPASGNNSATFKVDMALAGRVEFTAGTRQRAKVDGYDLRKVSLMTGTFDDQITQLGLIRRGESLPRPPIYIAVLSGLDPTVAPDGQDVLYVASNVPAQPRDGWETAKPWFAESILGSAAAHLSGIGDVCDSPEHSVSDY